MTGGAWTRVGTLRDERHYGGLVLPCHVERPRSLAALFAETASHHPEREAVVAGGRRVTYGELDRLAGLIAGNLAARGIVAGERVALLLCNGVEFVAYMMASARLGAIVVPLGARLKAPELDDAINDCGAAALVYESEYAGNLPEWSALPTLRLRILIDGAAQGAAPGSAFLAPIEAPAPSPAAEEDAAFILYTSGTTGRPKGAMLTHLGIIHSTRNFALCLELGAQDRAVLTVPASHVTGLVAIVLTMLGCGGCTIMMRAFKARDFLALAAA
jgi:long-chain acyl-CoA synthetase